MHCDWSCPFFASAISAADRQLPSASEKRAETEREKDHFIRPHDRTCFSCARAAAVAVSISAPDSALLKQSIFVRPAPTTETTFSPAATIVINRPRRISTSSSSPSPSPLPQQRSNERGCCGGIIMPHSSAASSSSSLCRS